MGMYSCLKVHCILKDEYLKVIKRLYEIYENSKKSNLYHSCVNIWSLVADKFNLSFIREWVKGRERTCMIPFSGEDTSLEEWDWSGLRVNEWKFVTKFKNYDNEINSFISMVLLKICKKIIHCEYFEDSGLMEDSIMFYENYEVV